MHQYTVNFKQRTLLLTSITIICFHFSSCGQEKENVFEKNCNGKKFTITQITLPGLDHRENYYAYKLQDHTEIVFGDKENVGISEPIADSELLKKIEYVKLAEAEIRIRDDSSAYNSGVVVWLSPQKFSKADFDAYKQCFTSLKNELDKVRKERTTYTYFISGLVYADIEDHTLKFRHINDKGTFYTIKPDGEILYQHSTAAGSVEQGYGGVFEANVKYPEKILLFTNKNIGLGPKETLQSLKSFRTIDNKTFEDYFKVIEVKTDTMQLKEFKSTLAETAQHYFIVSLKNKNTDIFEYNFDTNKGKIIVDDTTYYLNVYEDDGYRYNFKSDNENVMVICDHVFEEGSIEKSWPDLLHSVRIYMKGKKPWPLEFQKISLKSNFKK